MYGIQVNVGRVGEPKWDWMYDHNMEKFQFNTHAEATQAMIMWHPNGSKNGIFRVKEIE